MLFPTELSYQHRALHFNMGRNLRPTAQPQPADTEVEGGLELSLTGGGRVRELGEAGGGKVAAWVGWGVCVQITLCLPWHL